MEIKLEGQILGRQIFKYGEILYPDTMGIILALLILVLFSYMIKIIYVLGGKDSNTVQKIIHVYYCKYGLHQ